jgi:hypothetical protein
MPSVDEINLVVAVMCGELDPGSLCASGMTTGDVE